MFLTVLKDFVSSFYPSKGRVHTRYFNLDPGLVEKYVPPWFLKSPLVQMIVHQYWGIPKVEYKKEYIWFDDGVPCRLDTVLCNGSSVGTIVVFHGFGGSSKSSYCKHIVREFSGTHNVIVFNRRAHVPESFSWHPPTHFDKDDIEMATAYIKNKYGQEDRPIYAFGVSGGSNHLLRHVAESGNKCIFTKVMACGNGWNFDVATRYVKSLMMNKMLCSFGEAIYANVLAGERVFGYEDFRKQEEAIHGQHKIKEYYKSVSAIHKIKDITVPTLCLDSIDDPIYHYPFENLYGQNSNISFIYTSHGGHIAWIESLWPFNVYYTKVLRRWIDDQPI